MEKEDPRPNLEEQKKRKRPLLNLLWFIPAFLPAAISLSTSKSVPITSQKLFWILNCVCSLISGLGLWHRTLDKKLLQSLAGLGTGGFIFLLNIFIVICVVALLFFLNAAIVFYSGCCATTH
jgi:hypothetical protein